MKKTILRIIDLFIKEDIGFEKFRKEFENEYLKIQHPEESLIDLMQSVTLTSTNKNELADPNNYLITVDELKMICKKIIVQNP